MAKSKYDHLSADIRREGEAIILPETPAPSGMTYDQAIEAITARRDSEEAKVSVIEWVNGFAPFDAAHAFMVAMERKFGWVNSVPTPGFFSSPPAYVSVQVGPREADTMQVILGAFEIPGVTGKLQTHIAQNDKGRVTFVVTAETKRKYQETIRDLMTLTRQIVRDESIYRGKVVKLPMDGDGAVDWNQQIEFMDTRGVNPAEMVFSDELREQINVSLFTPIEQTAVCRKLRIPLKRGVLLEGTYGTGKTLVASVTAKVCEAHGWTFILIPDARGLAEAVDFAKRYAPAVVFCEDIDRQVHGDRSLEMDEILNTIDGIGAKSTEVMVVLTTNHVELINPAMLRPGRLDAVISVTPPDAAAARRLVRIYGRTLIAANDALDGAGEVLAGMIPAVIREVVERAKLAAIYRAGDANVQVTDADLVLTAKGMRRHLALLDRQTNTPSDAEVLAEKLHAVVGNGTGGTMANILARLEDIHGHVS